MQASHTVWTCLPQVCGEQAPLRSEIPPTGNPTKGRQLCHERLLLWATRYATLSANTPQPFSPIIKHGN